MHQLNGMVIEAKRSDVLDVLRKNRESHAKIVAEARIGYVDRARKAIEERLAQLREGRVVGLAFALRVPEDHTRVYDTAIKMLEMEQNDHVQLTAEQVRNLVMDEWDFSRNFFATNSAYSGTAQEVGAGRGYE